MEDPREERRDFGEERKNPGKEARGGFHFGLFGGGIEIPFVYRFGRLEGEWITVETDGRNIQHPEVVNKFTGRLLRGTELVANGEEGINGLSISNAAHLSSWLGRPVEIPVDEDLYFEKLQEKINNSTFKKTVNETDQDDMSSTFGS